MRHLLTMIAFLFFVPVLVADGWTQWRGPARDGSVPALPVWPDELKERLAPRWSVSLGPGYSGPVLNEDRVIVFSTEDGKRETLRAYSREDGKLLWEHAWIDSMRVPFFAAKNGSWVRSTPTIDGDRVYAGGMRDVLVCVDIETGKEHWRVDFKQRYSSPNPAFGFVSSPLIFGEHLFVQAGGGFVKLNKLTGESLWRVLDDGGGMYGSAFASPVLATFDKTPQLIVQTRELLCGVHPDTGDVLWRQKIEAFRGMNILTPTVWQDRVFTSAYGGRSHCFRVFKEGEAWKLEEVWNNKLQGNMCSPVKIGDHLYFNLRNRRFACVNAVDGSEGFISERAGAEYLSLIHQGERILGLDNLGRLHLIKANPQAFTVLESVQVVETRDTWAHIALDGSHLFIRSIDGLHVFDWK